MQRRGCGFGDGEQDNFWFEKNQQKAQFL
jgi:hypothetical protein